jgi:hypothetical protein
MVSWTATPAGPPWTTAMVQRRTHRSSCSRAAPAMEAPRDGSKMERGRSEPHHGQEAAVEAWDFVGDERGTVAVVEA